MLKKKNAILKSQIDNFEKILDDVSKDDQTFMQDSPQKQDSVMRNNNNNDRYGGIYIFQLVFSVFFVKFKFLIQILMGFKIIIVIIIIIISIISRQLSLTSLEEEGLGTS